VVDFFFFFWKGGGGSFMIFLEEFVIFLDMQDKI